MSRLRVTVVTNLFPSAVRLNRAAYNRQQFCRLAEDHDVTVLVAVAWLEWIKNIGSFKETKYGKLKVKYFPFFYIPKIAVYLHSAFLFCSMLPQIPFLKRYKPDVVLASWAFPDAVASATWCRILDLPLVVKVHGSDINVKANSPAQAKQIRWALSRAKSVICVSNALCNRLMDLGVESNRIKLLYNGVDLDVFGPGNRREANLSIGLEEHQKKILFVGNLEITKGCKELLLSSVDLLRSDNNVHLYYIGRGRAEKELKHYAEKAGCSRNVHFRGEIKHAELTHWYNAVDLISLPSYNEGVPNVLLEAMACGLPVVATRVGGIPEVVSEGCGILVESKDTDALKVALHNALNTQWDRELIIDNIKSMSWTANITQLEEVLYKSATENGCSK